MTVEFTDEELAVISKLAASRGMEPAEYVRAVIRIFILEHS